MTIKTQKIQEIAPAKINLFLEILHKRSDGYHELNTLFQALKLHDILDFNFKAQTGLSDELEFSLLIDSNNEEIKALGQQNIISKAIELYLSKLTDKTQLENLCSLNLEIFVDKKIPLEAGLAGGSSNAGATLRALNKFFQENFSYSLDNEELLKCAHELGSDVAFCLKSTETPRLLGKGRGEILENYESDFPYDKYPYILIIKPNFGISTAFAYKLYSKLEDLFVKERGFFNNFEKVIFTNFPELLEIKNFLLNNYADHVLLSGSGSAMLGFYSNLELYQKTLEGKPDWLIIKTSFR